MCRIGELTGTQFPAYQNSSRNPNDGCGTDVSGVMVVVGNVIFGKPAVSAKGGAICSAGSDKTGVPGKTGCVEEIRTGASGETGISFVGVAAMDIASIGNVQNRTDASKLPVTRLCVFGA
jgi:hypothetical protein